MTLRGTHLSDRRTEYDEVAYRETLRSLGLFAPVALDDINRTYRAQAKKIHPDRFATNGGAAEATERITRLNASHDYLVRHFDEFAKSQRRIARRHRGRGDSGSMAPLAEFLLLPVATVYSLTTLLAGIPSKLARWLSEREVDELVEVGCEPEEIELPAMEGWIVVGPHIVALMLFLAVEFAGVVPTFVRWWIGISLLVMLSTDIASRVTGEANPLRGHRAFRRVNAFVRGA